MTQVNKLMQQAVIYFCHTIQIPAPNKDHKFFGYYVVHFKHRDSPYVVHFKRRDCPYVVHFIRRDKINTNTKAKTKTKTNIKTKTKTYCAIVARTGWLLTQSCKN